MSIMAASFVDMPLCGAADHCENLLLIIRDDLRWVLNLSYLARAVDGRCCPVLWADIA
jgi:hypothetical protein